jgi:hypothetical protein
MGVANPSWLLEKPNTLRSGTCREERSDLVARHEAIHTCRKLQVSYFSSYLTVLTVE